MALTPMTTTTGNSSYDVQLTDDYDDEDYVNLQESQMTPAARTDETRGVRHDQFAMYELPKRDDSKPRPSIVNTNRKSLMPQ